MDGSRFPGNVSLLSVELPDRAALSVTNGLEAYPSWGAGWPSFRLEDIVLANVATANKAHLLQSQTDCLRLFRSRNLLDNVEPKAKEHRRCLTDVDPTSISVRKELLCIPSRES